MRNKKCRVPAPLTCSGCNAVCDSNGLTCDDQPKAFGFGINPVLAVFIVVFSSPRTMSVLKVVKCMSFTCIR